MQFDDERQGGDRGTRRRVPGQGPGQGGKRPRGLPLFLVALSALVLLLVLIANFGMEPQVEELKSSELLAKLDQKAVKSISMLSSSDSEDFEVRGEYAVADEGDPKTFRSRVSREEWEQLVREHSANPEKSRLTGVEYSTETVDDTFGWFLRNIVPFVIIFALVWFLFFRRGAGPMGGGVLNFGKSRARMFTKEDVTVTFNDVAGADEAKEEVAEIVEFLKNPQRFTRLGAKIPKGLLMVGPPGCGKTLLAKAIAGEADRPFFSISGSDFVEMFVGVGASRVRDLFRNARENAPCIIFIDEIDAVGRRRGSGVGGGHDEREQTLNAILVEMDGIGSAEGVIVLAATNRPDVLDAALLRPGRFDRQVVIDLPDVKGREEILRVHLKKIKVGESVDPSELARLTPGFSGADIMNLVNESALIAVMRNLDFVDRECLLEARERVRFGRQKRSRVMEEEERKVTAYHEAGHALVQELTPHTDKVHKVTIIPRGQALGATMSLPDKDRHSLAKSRAEELLMVLLAGRAAEEIFIGEVSAGAANDIQRATDIARHMVCEWGMSPKLGLLNYSTEEEHSYLGQSVPKAANYSDETARAIDGEMKRLVDEAWERTTGLLKQHRDKLENIAEALLEFETLDHDDLVWILDGKDLNDKRRHDEDERRRAQAAEKHRLMEERPGTGKPFTDGSGVAGRPETA